MPSRFSRRAFLRRTLEAGAGAAAVTTAGTVIGPLGGVAHASDRQIPRVRSIPAIDGPPPAAGRHSYVSRPDLRPPATSMVTAGDGSRTSPFIFLAPRVSPGGSYPSGPQRGLMILDRRGDLVWFQPLEQGGEDPFNFRAETYKGKRVLTWFQGEVSGAGVGAGGRYTLMDSSYKAITHFQAVNYPSDLHEFVLTSEGTALVTAYEASTSSHPVIGHAQEIDIATGDLVFDWPCWPDVPLSDSYFNPFQDYFHINSIDIWPGPERNLLISSRHTCAVYLVRRSDKQIIWRVGGKRSSFTMGSGADFYYQHDARALVDGSGISLFDDASQVKPGASPERQSSGKVLTLDQKAMTATLRHRYLHDTSSIDTGSQGNCQPLPTGGHFVGWGASKYFSEYGPSGARTKAPMMLDGRFPDGVESYRAFMCDWTGNPPLSELALVVHRASANGRFDAYVSWNGATEVARWVLEAGTSANTLETVADVPKLSFETVASFTRNGATAFRARAVGAAGGLVGQSGVVSAS